MQTRRWRRVQVAVTDPEPILAGLEISAKEKEELLAYIKLKMTPQVCARQCAIATLTAVATIPCRLPRPVRSRSRSGPTFRCRASRTRAWRPSARHWCVRGHVLQGGNGLTTPCALLFPVLLQVAAEACGTAAMPIRVQLIAPPLYFMAATCLDKEAGLAAMHAAIAVSRTRQLACARRCRNRTRSLCRRPVTASPSTAVCWW